MGTKTKRKPRSCKRRNTKTRRGKRSCRKRCKKGSKRVGSKRRGRCKRKYRANANPLSLFDISSQNLETQDIYNPIIYNTQNTF